MILVSGCLMGDKCRYDGKKCKNNQVIDYLKDKAYIKVCPEVMGGLDIPRIPAEIVGDQVITKLGQDVTSEFNLGAQLTLKIAQENNVQLAILKAKSPSCGYGQIYDGSFSGKLIEKNGITSELLLKNKIKIVNELTFTE